MSVNSFDARATLQVGEESYQIFRLDALEGSDSLPYSLKILLENLLRTEDGANITADDIRALVGWDPNAEPSKEIQFTPARVIMQDFTGVPCVVDLATMREAMADMGDDPSKINPLAPAELVIDHSVIADVFGTADAFTRNVEIEYSRNHERYQFLRWGQTAFDDFKVVPPGTGIVHQVNIEHLARVIFSHEVGAADGSGQTEVVAYPDTCVGTDSHTTMVNGLGVVGWGVGRDRGRSGNARPARLDVDSSGGGLQTLRRAAGGHDRNGSGADHYREAAAAQGRREVRRVLRAGRLPGAGRRPSNHRQHESGVRLHDRHLSH
jgi:aconitate hydratase